MGNTSFKRRLKSLILPVAAIVVLSGEFIYFHAHNNWTHGVMDKERYYFQVGKTKNLFTQRVFTKFNFENSPREAYTEHSFLMGSKFYADEPLDGLVDEIVVYRPFSEKPSLDLTRAEDYDKFKPEFEKADKDFAKNRSDFAREMYENGIN